MLPGFLFLLLAVYVDSICPRNPNAAFWTDAYFNSEENKPWWKSSGFEVESTDRIIVNQQNEWTAAKHGVLTVQEGGQLQVEAQSDQEQNAAICQMDVGFSAPWCHTDFIMLGNFCYRIENCQTGFQEAETTCANYEYETQTGHLVSHLPRFQFNYVYPMLRAYTMESEYYCGQCCPGESEQNCISFDDSDTFAESQECSKFTCACLSCGLTPVSNAYIECMASGGYWSPLDQSCFIYQGYYDALSTNYQDAMCHCMELDYVLGGDLYSRLAHIRTPDLYEHLAGLKLSSAYWIGLATNTTSAPENFQWWNTASHPSGQLAFYTGEDLDLTKQSKQCIGVLPNIPSFDDRPCTQPNQILCEIVDHVPDTVTYVCNGQSTTLTCDQGTITVKFARYGSMKENLHLCPGLSTPAYCAGKPKAHTDMVKNECEGNSQCTVVADPNLYEVDTEECGLDADLYLEIWYYCEGTCLPKKCADVPAGTCTSSFVTSSSSSTTTTSSTSPPTTSSSIPTTSSSSTTSATSSNTPTTSSSSTTSTTISTNPAISSSSTTSTISSTTPTTTSSSTNPTSSSSSTTSGTTSSSTTSTTSSTIILATSSTSPTTSSSSTTSTTSSTSPTTSSSSTTSTTSSNSPTTSSSSTTSTTSSTSPTTSSSSTTSTTSSTMIPATSSTSPTTSSSSTTSTTSSSSTIPTTSSTMIPATSSSLTTVPTTSSTTPTTSPTMVPATSSSSTTSTTSSSLTTVPTTSSTTPTTSPTMVPATSSSSTTSTTSSSSTTSTISSSSSASTTSFISTVPATSSRSIIPTTSSSSATATTSSSSTTPTTSSRLTTPTTSSSLTTAPTSSSSTTPTTGSSLTTATTSSSSAILSTSSTSSSSTTVPTSSPTTLTATSSTTVPTTSTSMVSSATARPTNTNFVTTEMITQTSEVASVTPINSSETVQSTKQPAVVSTLRPPLPLDETELAVTQVMQSLGCSFLMISLGVTMILFIILRDVSHERCFHMGQEFSLLCAHIVVCFLREEIEVLWLCKLSATLLQFFFVATFAFMTLEAFQFYAILSNMKRSGGALGRFTSLLIVLTLVGAIVLLSWTAHNNLPSIWTCWLNYGHMICLYSIVPIVVCSALTVVFTEAASIDSRTPLPNSSSVQRSTAIANRSAMVILLPLQLAGWFVGSFAVYHMNIYLFSFVFIINICLGVAIFVFHSLGNPKVHKLFIKLWNKLRPGQSNVQKFSKEPRDSILLALEQRRFVDYNGRAPEIWSLETTPLSVPNLGTLITETPPFDIVSFETPTPPPPTAYSGTPSIETLPPETTSTDIAHLSTPNLGTLPTETPPFDIVSFETPPPMHPGTPSIETPLPETPSTGSALSETPPQRKRSCSIMSMKPEISIPPTNRRTSVPVNSKNDRSFNEAIQDVRKVIGASNAIENRPAWNNLFHLKAPKDKFETKMSFL